MNTGLKIGKEPNFILSKLLKNNLPNWQNIEKLDWFLELEKCPQEPDFHAEGNVQIHTKMVVNALLKLPEYQSLNIENQHILIVAALMHDIAKPICTEIIDGKISSPKHAKVGEKVVRELCWWIDFEWREKLCALVRWHGLPLWAMQKPLPNAAVIASSLCISNFLLYILAKADVLGRITESQQELLERLEYFKMLCEENDCFDKPKSFYNAHSRFKFFHNRLEFPAELYDDTQFEITLMCGIAGSGKDTYIQNHGQNLPIISLDALRKEFNLKDHHDEKIQGQVMQKAFEMAKQYAAKKQNFIWNATTLTHEVRSGLLNMLGVYNPKFKIVYVETTQENILERRKNEIPANALLRMFRKLEIPQLTEAHEVIYIRNQ